ncbi:uncharacterized protein LOC132294941 isoform X2 [Cornus florida]|uniref:uncharacterized protein LOC132294941 isoform X2 n=1 Tax=Cornus florida TaxID=4283 RepID=UPI0028A0118E|nr:uncharacterized protein LOC132294941 isoform X2 [Cornus florida]
MNCLFRAYSTAILSRTSCLVARSPLSRLFIPTWKTKFEHLSVRTVDLEFVLSRFRIQCYSSRKGSSKSKSTAKKVDPKPMMEEEKDAFFVVRKGDIVGVYKNLSDCQAQVGSSICDPPVGVYKGYSMPKDTEEYLLSCGLKNALYSIRAADLKEDIFGSLVPCPFQEPFSSNGETSSKDLSKKRSLEMLESEVEGAVGSTSISIDPLKKHVKLDSHVEAQALSSTRSCILEFDGASKGNPGQAGAGAVLRNNDGSICRLREGLGIATNNVAEYRAVILGLRYALKKGFTNVRVLGDSKLVCMQIQGLWKAKNENMSTLSEEAKKLKKKFLSFEISHVLRVFSHLNSEADAQANFAVQLADGQVQEEEV